VKTVVVTGAAGFLGCAVVRQLAGVQVRVLPVSRRPLPGGVQVPTYRDTPRGDVLIHLAENASQSQVESAGSSYEEEASAVLAAVLAKGYERIVYASSAALYGDFDKTPRKPSDPVHVVNTYTRVKHHAEVAVLKDGLGSVARLSNLYGPGMSADNVMSEIIRQIPGRGALELRNTASVRDFLWVDDAATGLAMAAMSKCGGLYNFGTGVGTSIEDLAHEALLIAGQSDRPVVATWPAPRFSSLVVDISDTTSTFGWLPMITLRQGLGTLLASRREYR
jgi:UDP-glucose 4-epimerase